MTVFGDTSDLPSEIKKLHREIDDLRSKTEFQPILTTGRSDDGFGASVGSKTMNSGGVWSLTPVKYKLIDNPATGGTSYDMLELISACAVIEDNSAGGSVTDLELKTIRMASTNDPNASASSVTNSTPNGAILFIKPISGKTLTLKTGGNIHIDNDITLDEKGFAILQFYVSGTTVGANDEVKKKWIVLSGGGGSSVNSIKEPCRVATTGNNALHPVYNVTIDGVTLVEGQRLLVKNQTTARDNGIYVCGAVVSGASTFTRATDFDNDSEVKSGTLVTVNEGTANGNKVFMMTEDTNPIIVGTTAIYFTLVTSVDTALDYVWTGQHKFQGDPTGNIGDSNATHTVEFGNTGTDRIKFIGEITGEDDAVISDPDGGGTFTVPNSDPSISMKCAIVMNTYDIYDLDKTVFSQAVSSTSPPMLNNWVGIQANTGEDTTNNSNPPSPVLNGMSLNVPATKEFFFKVGKGTAGEEAEGSNVHEALIVSGDGIKLGDKISTPTGNGWLYLDGANMKAITGGATLNLSEMGTVKPDDEITWTDKHVWDNTTTWLESYTSDSVKATNCHVKIQGDGLEHDDYDYTDYDANPSQRVMEIGKYGTHEVKIIAEVTGHGNAVIVDPSSTDGTSEFTIPNSDPSISMKCALVMNTFSIYDLDQIVFGQGPSSTSPPMLNNWVGVQANTGEDTSGGSSPPNPTLNGMSFHVPDNKEFFFKVGKGTAGEEATGSYVTEIFRISENGIKIAGSSAPSSPANGMIWHNSSDNKVYARSNGATVELGSGSGGGADNLGNHTATTTLNMNTQNITGVGGITFNSGATIITDSTGIDFSVPSGDDWMFKIGSTNKFYISNSLFRIYTELDMNYQKIIKVGTPSASSGTFAYDVPNMGSLTGVSPAYTINTGHLGSGTANSTKFLRGDSTWQTVNATVDQTSNYTWSGVHKFQNSLTELGNSGSDVIKFIGEITGEGNAVITDPDGNGTMTIPNSDPSISVKAGIVMNTYTMYDLDTLVFSQSASSTTPAPESDWVWIEANTGTGSSPVMNGMHYNVPSGKTHQFKINGTEELRIGSNGITFSTNSTNTTSGSIWYDGSNLKAKTSSGGTFTIGSGGGGSGADTDLNNLTNTSINKDLDPSDTSGNRDLGNSSYQWGDLWITGTAYLDAIGFGNYSMSLPTSRGSNGQVLTTNGSNSLSWTSVSGGSGADTSLSNLSSTGESHFDTRYARKSTTNTWTGVNTFSQETNVSQIDFAYSSYYTSSGPNSNGSYDGAVLYPVGWIKIKVGGVAKKLAYYNN